MNKNVRFFNALTHAFNFFLPLFEDAFVLYYLLFNPFGILVKLGWESSYGVAIPRVFLFLFRRDKGRNIFPYTVFPSRPCY